MVDDVWWMFWWEDGIVCCGDGTGDDAKENEVKMRYGWRLGGKG